MQADSWWCSLAKALGAWHARLLPKATPCLRPRAPPEPGSITPASWQVFQMPGAALAGRSGASAGWGVGGSRRVRDATDPSSETATHREMGALPTLGSSHCARSSPVPCLKLTCFSISLSLAFAASRSAADMGVTSKPALLILVAPDAAAMVWEAVEAARLVLDPMTAGQRRTQAAMLAVKSALARHARIGQLQVVR